MLWLLRVGQFQPVGFDGVCGSHHPGPPALVSTATLRPDAAPGTSQAHARIEQLLAGIGADHPGAAEGHAEGASLARAPVCEATARRPLA